MYLQKKFLFIGLLFLVIVMPIMVISQSVGAPVESTTVVEFLEVLTKILLMVVLPIAVIAVLVSAFFIIQGSSEKVQKAKRSLTYSLIGLVIVIIAAGSSAFFMDIMGLERVPGVTHPLPWDEAWSSIEGYLGDEVAKEDPVLKDTIIFKESLEQCSI